MSTRSILYLYENLHERYYFFFRRPMSQDQVIKTWFVKWLIIMADYKMAAMKSLYLILVISQTRSWYLILHFNF